MKKTMFDIGKTGSEQEITEALASTTHYAGVNRDLIRGALSAFTEDGRTEALQQVVAQVYAAGFSDKNIAARALVHAVAGEENGPVMSAAEIATTLADFDNNPVARQDILNRATIAAVDKLIFADPLADEAKTIAVLKSLKDAGADFGHKNNLLLQVAFKKSTGAVIGFIAENGGDLEAAAADAAKSNDVRTSEGLKNHKTQMRLTFLEAAHRDLQEQFRAETGHAPKPFPRAQTGFEGPTRW